MLTSIRPTHVVVDLQKLTHNYQAIVKHVAPAWVMPILKANAYGHGLIEIATHLTQLGAPYLGVAYLEEGLALRASGLTTPILILGGLVGEQIEYFIRYDLTLTASSISKLQEIDKVAARLKKIAKVHLKIDTGMERLGVHYYHARNFLEASLLTNHCFIEGIYSHLADAENPDLTTTNLQVARFQEVLQFYSERNIPRPPLCHLNNSGGLLQSKNSNFNCVRPGILLYGVYPAPHLTSYIQVEPLITWKSKVVYFKVVNAHTPVGYNGSATTQEMNRVVTVPVGYGDGYMRRMSEHARVLIRDQQYPVIGRICMDQLMVNLGSQGTAYNGDTVILLGKSLENPRLEITVLDLARWADTSPYEILTNINARVPRLYTT